MTTDAQRDVRRNRLVLTVTAVVMLLGLALLVALAAARGQWSPSLLGLALLVAALTVLTLDA